MLKKELALTAYLTRLILLLQQRNSAYATVGAAVTMYQTLPKEEGVDSYAGDIARKLWAKLRPVSHIALSLDCAGVDVLDLWKAKTPARQVTEVADYATVLAERLMIMQPAHSRKESEEDPFALSLMQTEKVGNPSSRPPKAANREAVTAYLTPNAAETEHLNAFKPKVRSPRMGPRKTKLSKASEKVALMQGELD